MTRSANIVTIFMEVLKNYDVPLTVYVVKFLLLS